MQRFKTTQSQRKTLPRVFQRALRAQQTFQETTPRAIHGENQIGRRASEMQYLVEAWAPGMRFQGFFLTPSELGDILI